MARLPTVSGDDGNWGSILNTFLQVAHNADGTLKNLVLNIKDYGAVGDGTTDDTTAIQNALNAANTAGGGIVYVPAGTYKLTTTLFIYGKTTFMGTGAASILKQTGTGSTNAIANHGWNDIVGDTDITIRDMTLDGNSGAAMGVVYAGVQRGTIHNLYVKNFLNYSIWLWSSGEGSSTSEQGLPSRHITVSACHVTNAVDVGIEVDAGVSCTIVGNSIHTVSGLGGIYLWNGAADCTVSDNVIEGQGTTPAATGIRISNLTPGSTYTQNTAHNTICNNTIRNIQTGIRVRGSSGNIVADAIIENNTVQCWTGTTTIGLDMGYCTRIMVRGNYFYNAYDGFMINVSGLGGGTTTDSTIDGNYFYLSASQGSKAYQMDGGSISNNVFTQIANHAMSFFGCTNLVISGNVGIDCGNSTSGTIGLIVLENDTGSVACLNNVLNGNKIMDRRGSKYLYWAVLLIDDSDYNLVTSNSARGAYVGGRGYQNGGTGTHNTAANNIDN